MKYFSLTSILFCAVLSAQQPDYDRARTAYFSGQYEEALTEIEQCIAHDTANYRYVFLKGKTLENLYRYSEAITAQEAALRLNPESVEARAALATLFLLSGQPAVSAQFYEQLVTAEPQVNRWKMSWATALQASGKPKEALEQLKIVKETDTINWVVYKNMGDCYFRLDSLEQTIRHYYMALKLYPDNKNLWGTLTRILVTNAYYVEGFIESAITVGNQAIAFDSTNVEVWKYLGAAYYKITFMDGAYTALGKALALGDSSFTTLSHFGILKYHRAYYREAEKYLEKARQLDPNDIITMNYLVSTYGYTGKAQNGLDILDELDERIAEFDSVGMRANPQRGYLLSVLNRHREAVGYYIAATKDLPDDIRNYYEVARCYDVIRNKKLALEWYTRYLEKIDPNWATRQWTQQELKKFESVTAAKERIQALKTDLFFEEEKKGK